MKNEAVHYDELEEAWIKKIQYFCVGRDDQSVDLYIDITDRLALHTALGEPSIRILECNRDPNKHYADCSYIGRYDDASTQCLILPFKGINSLNNAGQGPWHYGLWQELRLDWV